jgi:phospholipase/carboxylesterase
MNRRSFITMGAAGALALARRATLSAAQPERQPEFTYGQSRLGIVDDERDGTLYVPKAYKPGVPMPAMMMLHGFAGSADGVRSLFPLAEEFGVILIAPESRGLTWGQSIPGFDADVRYLGPAYRYVTSILDIDRQHVALAGISDGAGYALSMGLAYGDTFNHVIVLSGGLMIPFRYQGMPRFFFAHGLDDMQMPIDRTARLFVPELKAKGYDVTLHEYQGGHRVPPAEMREAFKWFVASKPQ